MRVYDLAVELGVETATVRAVLADMNRSVKSASSTIDEVTAAEVRSKLGKAQGSANLGASGNSDPRKIPGVHQHLNDWPPKNAEIQLLDPVEFLQPDRRLFIDTNVFMETDPRREGGLKRLFELGLHAILSNHNPIVVPNRVISELNKQSQHDTSTESEQRATAIKKAGTWLTFLKSASENGLVRTDLGADSNPYADDLFVRLFERFADTYEMLLLTSDITVQLRIRLLAQRLRKRLLVGALTKEGDLEVRSDQALFEQGLRKYARHTTHISEGHGNHKDESEVETLKPLLADFGKAFRLRAAEVRPGRGTVKKAAPERRGAESARVAPFSAIASIQPHDSALAFTLIPAEGDQVMWESARGSGTLVLGSLLGEGGEGAVYAGASNSVVKIFDDEHITRHRKEKIELLVSHGLEAKGLCVPSASVKNHLGEFVGYVMPKASGREFQRTIFNKRKFEKEYPDWKKTDLVDICISFLEKVQYLHSMNVILGDINPKNLMIDDKKNVFIIDADSWQVEGYPCPVGTPMFTSPAMLGKTYSDDLRTMEDELFAVATMLFMIVMTGQFPYIRTGTDGDMVHLIKEGNFAFQYENRNNRDQPDGDWKYMWSHIHKPVKDLFWHTFHKEGKRYNRRPPATEWLKAFMAYKAYLADNRMSFDPMSNDVYPIRPKAFRPDTPLQDCPNCDRENAIAGIWNDESEDYFVPKLCNKCKDAHPPRKTPYSRPTPATSDCKDCARKSPREQLAYGRCPACAAQANSLDAKRLCIDCHQPFITHNHIGWFASRGLEVPKSHTAIKQTCPATGAASPSPSTKPGSQAQIGFWARLKKWFQSS